MTISVRTLKLFKDFKKVLAEALFMVMLAVPTEQWTGEHLIHKLEQTRNRKWQTITTG